MIFSVFINFILYYKQDVGLNGSVLVFGKAAKSQFNCEENNIHTYSFCNLIF